MPWSSCGVAPHWLCPVIRMSLRKSWWYLGCNAVCSNTAPKRIHKHVAGGKCHIEDGYAWWQLPSWQPRYSDEDLKNHHTHTHTHYSHLKPTPPNPNSIPTPAPGHSKSLHLRPPGERHQYNTIGIQGGIQSADFAIFSKLSIYGRGKSSILSQESKAANTKAIPKPHTAQQMPDSVSEPLYLCLAPSSKAFEKRDDVNKIYLNSKSNHIDRPCRHQTISLKLRFRVGSVEGNVECSNKNTSLFQITLSILRHPSGLPLISLGSLLPEQLWQASQAPWHGRRNASEFSEGRPQTHHNTKTTKFSESHYIVSSPWKFYPKSAQQLPCALPLSHRGPGPFPNLYRWPLAKGASTNARKMDHIEIILNHTVTIP